MSTQPPAAPGDPALPAPGTLRCPRCSSPVGPDQDWCLECGAPARTRLAQTPNWQLPTVAIAAIILIAGAMLAFAFVKLTQDEGAPVATTATTPTTVAPPVLPPASTTPAPVTSTPTAPVTTPTATTPTTTTPTTTTPGATTSTTKPTTKPTTTTPTITQNTPPPPLAPRTTAPSP